MNPAHELHTLIDALRALRHAGDTRAALATITRTRGATFRRVGTHMLVHADGRVVCELSGGCPQRDIVLHAQQAIASGEPRRVRYNAESGLDLLMEMGCGGELDILIEPLTQPDASDFIEPLAQCLQQRRQACMATWFASDRQIITPRRLLWSDEGLANSATRYDQLADDALGRALRENCHRDPPTRAITVELPSTAGTAEVLIEPIMPPHALVMIGGGAVARALLPLADALGWQTTLVESDPGRLREIDAPGSSRLLCAGPAALRDALPFDRFTSVVLMTHNLQQDIAWLAALRDVPLVYLGALGSRERVQQLHADATFGGPPLHAPAGLDIGAETPTEIALAITAEIMAVINGRGGGALCDSNGSIHP